VIIGSGPGGYVAAVRAAQLGMKTAVVEKAERLGGVCLNVGCIPSKALLDSSEYYHLAKDRFAEYGIKTGKVTLDLAGHAGPQGQGGGRTDRKRAQAAGRQQDRDHPRHGNWPAPGTVRWIRAKKKDPVGQIYPSGHRLRAHGEVRAWNSTANAIVSSTEALDFDTVPKHLGIVGGGYIGLELGSVWRRLGATVTVIEMLPKIATTLDGQVGRPWTAFSRQGMAFRLNTKVVEAKRGAQQGQGRAGKRRQTEEMTFDRLLVSVGRRPLTKGLGIEELGIETDPKTGQILVDETYRTSVDGIYAIGDLVPGPMLAHKASAEGTAAVECMAGRAGEVNYDTIPAVVYTWPEVASVGLTEEQVREKEIPTAWAAFPFPGRAAPAAWAKPTGSSSSSPTARPTASWASTSSAPGRRT
jgi:dihydrolipoamide dehydrogenase